MRRSGWFAGTGLVLIAAGVACHPSILPHLLGRRHGFIPDTAEFLKLMTGILAGAGLLLLLLRNRPGTLANVGLAAFSLFVFLAGAELYLRRFAPQLPKGLKLFRTNPDWGWEFIPGGRGEAIFPSDYRGMVTLNSDGLRDREYSKEKPAGRKRILVLGDSFTAGVEVDPPQVFTEIMEDSLFRGVDVINFGINGFGPTQEYLILKGRGLGYHPDIVLMVIYVRNDFDDVLGNLDWGFGYPRPRAVLRANGEIAIMPAPKPPALPPRESRFSPPSLAKLQLVALCRRLLSGPNSAERIPPETRMCRKDAAGNPTGDFATACALMRGVIKRTRDLCREGNVSFAVVVAPSVVEVSPEKFWPAIQKAYGLNPSNSDLYLPHRVLAGICSDLGVPECDLLDALRARTAAGGDAYYHRNQHWNKVGHAVVAREVARFLEGLGWIQADETRAEEHAHS